MPWIAVAWETDTNVPVAFLHSERGETVQRFGRSWYTTVVVNGFGSSEVVELVRRRKPKEGKS